MRRPEEHPGDLREEHPGDDPELRDLRRLQAAGRLLPSELRHRVLLRWPHEAAAMLGCTQGVLLTRQARGDHPTLTRLGRQQYVAPRHLDEWIAAHADDPQPKRKRAA